MHFTRIPDVAAPVKFGIRIENLPPFAGKRHTYTVVVVNIRREIHRDKTSLSSIVAFPNPGKNVVSGIVRHHPFKACWIAIQLVQGRQSSIELI